MPRSTSCLLRQHKPRMNHFNSFSTRSNHFRNANLRNQKLRNQKLRNQNRWPRLPFPNSRSPVSSRLHFSNRRSSATRKKRGKSSPPRNRLNSHSVSKRSFNLSTISFAARERERNNFPNLAKYQIPPWNLRTLLPKNPLRSSISRNLPLLRISRWRLCIPRRTQR